MSIKSVIETSLIDWDAKIVMVLFMGGCNFRCPFCQNWEIAFNPGRFDDIPWDEVARRLNSRRDWIDGLVISGGEPLLDQASFQKLCQNIKNLNFPIKIDTNGSDPELLKKAVNDNLVDYVALDVKAPLDERYYVAAGKKVNLTNIKKSMAFLKTGGVPYEFRTTAVPGLITEETIVKIGEDIEGARLFSLQQFVPRLAYDTAFQQLKPYTREEAEKLMVRIKKYVKKATLRGF